MKGKVQLIQAAMCSIIALTAISPALAANSTNVDNMEKCYGIAKAGLNDCASGKASCASSATLDKQADAFLLLPKGLCDKIVGGSTKPKIKPASE